MPDREPGRRLTVAMLTPPRLFAMDLSIPAHILGGHPGYAVRTHGEQGEPLAGAAGADILVVPGYEEPEQPLPAPYLDLIRAAADRGSRVVSICTATFALAEAGVLDNRDATTHWQYTERLRVRFPLVNVLDNRLYVEDGTILTSAGGGAGIDACLLIVRTDYGEAAAREAGNDVAASPVRGGGEPQYVELPLPPRADLTATRAWVLSRLGEPVTVAEMAAHSNLSRRTFIRHFEQETGEPPMRWVLRQRVLAARRLLERSDWSVERIASASGFGTAANFRALFRREVGHTPTGYRRAHADSGTTSVNTPM